jgi:hypothetical protein
MTMSITINLVDAQIWTNEFQNRLYQTEQENIARELSCK